MAYYLPYSCGGELTPQRYVCSDCTPKDKGRVRHIILYDEDYSFVDPTSFAEWNALFNAHKSDEIRTVLGSYDGGQTSEEDGFGDNEFTNGNTSHTLIVKDPNFFINRDFYDYIKNATGKKIAFASEHYIWMPASPVNVSVALPIDESIKSNNVAVSTIKWADADLPVLYTKPAALFTQCRIYT